MEFNGEAVFEGKGNPKARLEILDEGVEANRRQMQWNHEPCQTTRNRPGRILSPAGSYTCPKRPFLGVFTSWIFNPAISIRFQLLESANDEINVWTRAIQIRIDESDDGWFLWSTPSFIILLIFTQKKIFRMMNSDSGRLTWPHQERRVESRGVIFILRKN